MSSRVEPARSDGHRGAVTCCLVTGNVLISGASDGSVLAWDASTGARRFACRASGSGNGGSEAALPSSAISSSSTARRAHDSAVSAVLVADGRLFTAAHDRTIKAWSLTDGTLLAVLKAHTTAVTALAAVEGLFGSDGMLLSGASDGSLLSWETNRSAVVTKFTGGHKATVNACLVVDAVLYSAGMDRRVVVWEFRTGRKMSVFKGHRAGIHAMVYAAESQQLITGSEDTTVRVWNVKRGECVAELDGHRLAVHGLAFHAKKKRLFSASADKTVRQWDLGLLACTSVFEGHTGGINACTVNEDASQLYTASNDKTLRSWDVESKETSVVFGSRMQQLLGRGDFMRAQMVLQVADLAIETIQIIAFPFTLANLSFSDSVSSSESFFKFFQFSVDGVDFAYQFWPAVAAVLLFLVCYLAAGLGMAADKRRKTGAWYGILLWLWLVSTILYVPIVRALLTAIDCTRVGDVYTLDADPSVFCWQGSHLIVASIAIALFCLMVVPIMRLIRVEGIANHLNNKDVGRFSWFTTSMKDDDVDERYQHLLSQRSWYLSLYLWVMKTVLLAVTLIFASHTKSVMFTIAACAALAVVIVIALPPYHDPRANSFRAALAFVVLYYQTCALVVAFGYLQDDPLAAIVFFAGGPVIAVLTYFLIRWLPWTASERFRIALDGKLAKEEAAVRRAQATGGKYLVTEADEQAGGRQEVVALSKFATVDRRPAWEMA